MSNKTKRCPDELLCASVTQPFAPVDETLPQKSSPFQSWWGGRLFFYSIHR